MNQHYGSLVRCPACDEDLGVGLSYDQHGRVRKPSLRLELCVEGRGVVDWRLSLWDGSRSWPPSPRFHAARVHLVYRLCGDGHVFLDHVVTGGSTPAQPWTVDRFDVIAAVGGVAAGKSYLMLRTLSQHLAVGGMSSLDPTVATTRVSVYNADWLLEAAPLDLLKRHYLRTEIDGLPLDPTTLRDMLPFEFLAEHVAPGLVQQILDIHLELLGPDNVDKRSWGQRIRQPIVRRYQIGDQRVLAAVADLAGESFDSGSANDRHNRYLLSNYGTLVWVIDPVICSPFVKFLPQGVARSSVPASMRPDVVVNDKTEEVRKTRNQVQRELANTLTETGGLAIDHGPDQYLLVSVTKADLIRLALDTGRTADGGFHPARRRTLRDLGAKDAVVTGVTRYLAEVARRSGGQFPSIVVDDLAAATLIGRIRQFAHDPQLGVQVARQLADALVDHYSDPDEFWELVHGGAGTHVEVPERVPEQILKATRITVPSLDEHVAASLLAGQGGVLRTRDIVMSALGCGVACGLGFAQSIDLLLQQEWRELRFFLCSPLGEVPVTVTSSDQLIAPRDSDASFPEFDARSAALCHLLLCMLRRVRP
ncbi:hypothetical protein [Actinokineospora sp. NBRC 105648]|uniref:hypothetical protein n=1 Tax=Actinokineospora sp. NBRC 105648 TaxID=3032206 RepID=UPI0024A55844|nr:hypothetical protein [Actinokineospora sp. NBRC 105648]GLZ40798.1 hypothetical protein Acsp05_44220 [Actinokineospora sp. NBRC 105648]